jgi:REP element-mobilizing transposase RayT
MVWRSPEGTTHGPPLRIYIFHCVFSTKQRVPEIREPEKLWAYLHGIAQNLNIETVAIGGTMDHVHVLMAPPATMPISEAVQKLKANSSRWIRGRFPWSGWQEGYGLFSVSQTAVPAVKRYIQHQKTHHQKRNSREEFILMLQQAVVVIDDQVE